MDGRLICNKISKTYPRGTTALKNINLDMPTKGIFALIGRNGAGKTTLVRILATQLLQSSGEASINGIDVRNDPGKIREFIAIVPQEARLISWVTPRQMVIAYLLYRGYTYGESRKRAANILHKLKMEKYADKQSQYLSGGTKRRALVATIIASEAQILFLDEPTTGLDPISRAELWKTLNELKKDHFIFLTTHYLEEAEILADNIGIIENGKLLAQGTIEELRKIVKYEYSVKVLEEGVVIKPRKGEVVVGLDGKKQIFAGQKEANRISKILIKKGVRFSSSPISLEEIFYYIVRQNIDTDEDNADEEE